MTNSSQTPDDQEHCDDQTTPRQATPSLDVRTKHSALDAEMEWARVRLLLATPPARNVRRGLTPPTSHTGTEPTMSKTTTKNLTPKPTPKSTRTSNTSGRHNAPDASANDKARAEAMARLNAAPAAKPVNPSTSVHPAQLNTPGATAKPLKTADATPRGSGTRAPRAITGGTKRMSALDAAARVLGTLHAREARTGLTATELIERMATAGLWTSPGGKTPAATLYAAMTREIAAKSTASRFARADASADGSRGRFVATAHTARRAKA